MTAFPIMSINPDDLADLFAQVEIGADTTRTAASRVKRAQHRRNCATCLRQFANIRKLRKHLHQDGHIHDREELKSDLREAETDLTLARATRNAQEIKSAEFNKQLAMLRLISLEKVFRE